MEFSLRIVGKTSRSVELRTLAVIQILSGDACSSCETPGGIIVKSPLWCMAV